MHSQLDNGMTVQLKKSFCFFVYILCVFLFTFIRVDLQCACCHWLQGRFACWSWTFKIHASGWQNRLKSLHVWGILFLVKGLVKAVKVHLSFLEITFKELLCFFFTFTSFMCCAPLVFLYILHESIQCYECHQSLDICWKVVLPTSPVGKETCVAFRIISKL